MFSFTLWNLIIKWSLKSENIHVKDIQVKPMVVVIYIKQPPVLSSPSENWPNFDSGLILNCV